MASSKVMERNSAPRDDAPKERMGRSMPDWPKVLVGIIFLNDWEEVYRRGAEVAEGRREEFLTTEGTEFTEGRFGFLFF
jgi:hypothetical protein